ncbi:flavoprotein [Amycolatopsis albispora]|uniref:Flavoprotein n=1 Tax=Amycolatopsis albispora TaxID=1804986 RepID=A0A344L004_9PSEU|nr:flavoprotein [Amycolatopsis albispora]AXB41378.1 flavoprotein [Amycolatopsis albispora]
MIEDSGYSGAPRVLVGATGSIAVTNLPGYLAELRGRLAERLTVLMTHTAEKFLPATTVAMHADQLVSGDSPADWPAAKPSRLVAEHDILVVLPATANVLAAAAAGAAPNRLSTVILAATFPVVYFPSMGAAMWEKPATRRNIATIRADGGHVPEPVWHDTYDVGLGRNSRHPTMPSPAEVAKIVGEILSASREN